MKRRLKQFHCQTKHSSAELLKNAPNFFNNLTLAAKNRYFRRLFIASVFKHPVICNVTYNARLTTHTQGIGQEQDANDNCLARAECISVVGFIQKSYCFSNG
jgi:hypothetical protein